MAILLRSMTGVNPCSISEYTQNVSQTDIIQYKECQSSRNVRDWKRQYPKISIQERTYSSHKSIQIMQGVNKYKNCFVVLSNCVNLITSKFQHVNTSRMQILKKTKGSHSSLGRIVCLNMHSRSKVVSVISLHVRREDTCICICSGSV